MSRPAELRRIVRVTGLGLALSMVELGLVAGCSDTAPTAIHIDQLSATADTELQIRVDGVAPGERIDITAQAADYAKNIWRSEATFVADGEGTVDLGAVAPVDGTYSGVDAMGLFWSMNKESGADDAAAFYPLWPDQAEAYDVLLTATPERSEAVSVRVHRAWLTPGVTHRTLDLASDKVVGEIYEPSTQSRGGVLLLGGSEGGISGKYQAALLASHGFTALALGYFALPGLPQTLHDIPIEYFATAARLLPGTIRVIGYSRGTEAALLLSALYPDVVRGTAVLAPADRVWPAFPPPGNAWTYRGEPLTAIPFGQIAGPVLAIAGTDDQLWPAGTAAGAVAQATGGESMLCAGAGHGVGGLPYLPAGTTFRHPITGEVLHLGGTREANEKAHQRAWARVLQFLT